MSIYYRITSYTGRHTPVQRSPEELARVHRRPLLPTEYVERIEDGRAQGIDGAATARYRNIVTNDTND